MSKICDLCGKSMSHDEMHLISSSDMKQAVRNGWQSSRSSPMSDLGEVFGFSKTDLKQQFYDLVMSNHTEWGVCHDCFDDFKKAKSKSGVWLIIVVVVVIVGFIIYYFLFK